MFRSLMAICAAAVFAGCASSPPASVSPADDPRSLVDQQILAASEKIQRSQAELFAAAALSAPVVAPPANIRDDGQRVTLTWKGDAADLVRTLAQQRGLTFTTAGVKLPLPVSLSLKDEPFRDVLQLLRAQIGYRAVIVQVADRVVLEYSRPQVN